MKFVVSRGELAQLVRKIQNIVPQNAPIPILSHVLIEAKGEELIFTATDLTVGVRCTTNAKVFEEGAITLPSKRFFHLVRELTEANLEVVCPDGEMAQITVGSSQFRLHGLDKQEFPSLPDLADATQFTVDGDLLKEMLDKTAFAVAKEDNRYALTGVLMRVEESKATFVGTDGKRLAKTEMEISLSPEGMSEYVLPIKAVDEICKTLSDDETATIYLTPDKVAVSSGNTLIVTKLFAEDYPDFEQVTACKSEVSCDLHREELMTLLRQISLFTGEHSHSVRFTFTPGEVTLTANCQDVGEGKVSMPVNYSGEKLDIAFNPFFFLDFLRHSQDEAVTIGLSDSYNPGIITDSSSALFILMPMRLTQPA